MRHSRSLALACRVVLPLHLAHTFEPGEEAESHDLEKEQVMQQNWCSCRETNILFSAFIRGIPNLEQDDVADHDNGAEPDVVLVLKQVEAGESRAVPCESMHTIIDPKLQPGPGLGPGPGHPQAARLSLRGPPRPTHLLSVARPTVVISPWYVTGVSQRGCSISLMLSACWQYVMGFILRHEKAQSELRPPLSEATGALTCAQV
jgi:hypothetical protein